MSKNETKVDIDIDDPMFNILVEGCLEELVKELLKYFEGDRSYGHMQRIDHSTRLYSTFFKIMSENKSK